MRDPKDVLTEHGYRRYQTHVDNINEGLFFILNHEDDLELDQDIVEKLLEVQTLIENNRI